ncbi:MAG: 1-deoxy-D-xylulose-5-phosphate reductoisomerase, partial [Gammaproteobacteria bacterium]|nr:1-deoxy-D-xylulose-5-phosphate reductoisomerase [Gammaproteobacteria bacterium]
MKGISILGATGSIGVNTLDVVARHPEKYKIVALSANGQVDRLVEQCEKYQPEYAVMANEKAAEELESKLKNKNISAQVLSGMGG